MAELNQLVTDLLYDHAETVESLALCSTGRDSDRAVAQLLRQRLAGIERRLTNLGQDLPAATS